MARLAVAFLWHQHQPLYKNPRSGGYSLPWVRLHALKDYYDMAALAGEFSHLHITINLVPSLLDQIDDYAEGRASDPALDLARRAAADLDEEERLALLDLFFSVPYRTLIAPYPRYAGLYHKRAERGPDGDYKEALSRFRDRDLRDLQVWFHLAWCGQTLRRSAQVQQLLAKGEGFTEDEKGSLLDLQAEFMREIVPIHKRLMSDGIAEISTSPYYHPILPLLCDLESAREALPELPLPDLQFRHRPDAEFQVREALASMNRRFGKTPLGMWPSEGSLSEETIRIFGEAKLVWTASDEGVLRESAGHPLRPGDVHRPHLLAGAETGPVIFFRDHHLSDLVGFTYSTWPPRAAAEDFLGRLRALAEEAPGGVVSVVLDGENAWEHYEGNGVEFLRALYSGLTSADDLQTVTLSQAAERTESVGRLEHLRAGSWIGANFSTWIGHQEKNTAWSLLAAARNEAEARLGSRLESHPVYRILAAAEGSDWFWWFGDDHSSEQDAVFDAAFRDLLRAVYEMLGLPAPAEIDLPIKRTRPRAWRGPTGPVLPVLDGEVTDYFEWLAAGTCEASCGQGAMHQTTELVRRVAFGSDGASLFIRVDPSRGDVRALLASLPDGALGVEFLSAEPLLFSLRLDPDGLTHKGSTVAARYAAGSVLEIELPLADAPRVEFFVWLASGGGMLQRLPRDGVISLVPGDPADWSV